MADSLQIQYTADPSLWQWLLLRLFDYYSAYFGAHWTAVAVQQQSMTKKEIQVPARATSKSSPLSGWKSNPIAVVLGVCKGIQCNIPEILEPQ